MESKQFSFNKKDIQKILVGACIAMGGAFLTYASAIITNIDFGVYTPIIVAIASILINACKKFLEGK
jgi:hypothetical protein